MRKVAFKFTAAVSAAQAVCISGAGNKQIPAQQVLGLINCLKLPTAGARRLYPSLRRFAARVAALSTVQFADKGFGDVNKHLLKSLHPYLVVRGRID